MNGKNKFGFAPMDAAPAQRSRSVGPMGAAVREAAESLTESTEAKIEQRRRNAEDARTYRAAAEEGRVLQRLPLSEIATDDLPRDRMELEAVAQSTEMAELRDSISARGQKEPVEVYVGADGRYQLKKGWRRLTALSQLYAETGEPRFAEIIARVDSSEADRLSRYIDMVEENVIREDLSFAEMAQVAINAAQDSALDGDDPEDWVGRLYGSLHKMKRSYVKSFVQLLVELGESLRFPKEVSRNLGLDVVRAIRRGADVRALRERLASVEDKEGQALALTEFVASQNLPNAGVNSAVSEDAAPEESSARRTKLEKFEFHVGSVKVTARRGECRIVGPEDYSSVPREQLVRAVKAFEAALSEEGNPRVTSL